MNCSSRLFLAQPFGIARRLLILALLLPLGCSAQAEDRSDLESLSDEFDDPATLSNWKRVYREEGSTADQLEAFDIGKSREGWMTLVPHTSTWYQDYRGVLVHKRVSGDFVVTTSVHATNRAGDGPPRSNFSLAGIMVRTPRDVTPQTWRPGGENYIFLSLGAARNPGRYSFEVKTTQNSRSQLETEDTDTPDALIRIARIGDSFLLLKKPARGEWSVHQRYRRSDMPEELQVGLTVYTDYGTASRLSPAEQNTQVVRGGRPDLKASFEYVRFGRPNAPESLAGKNPADPRAVSDAELLAFLGAPADRQ